MLTDLFNDGATHPRYADGALMRRNAQVVSSGGRAYTLLEAPFLTRRLRQNEWGVHDGISAWESLVPLLIGKE